MNLDFKKQRLVRWLVYGLILSTLYGCTGVEDAVFAPNLQTPSVKQTPTPAPLFLTSTSTPFNTSTPVPNLTTHTQTSTTFSTATSHANQVQEYTPTPRIMPDELENQTVEGTADACIDTTLLFKNSLNGKVRWRSDDTGEVYCCEPSGIYRIYHNPALMSDQAVFSIIVNSYLPTYSTNVLIDLTNHTSKILGRDYTDTPRYLTDWLTDETVVWADEQGEMYIGTIETQESLNVPAQMTDLWFVAPDKIVTRDEQFRFWDFDLTNSAWTQWPIIESEKITTRWIDYAAVSDDSDYIFFFFPSYSAVLSVDSRTIQTATPTFPSEDKYYVVVDTMEGDIFSPPLQIKETPYWFFRTEWIFREFSQISYPTKGFVVDSRTGEVVNHEILGIPPELAIYNSYLSPDRVWVAVEVVEATETLETHPAQVSQTWFISLNTGEARVEDGGFEGWDTERQAYLNAPLACTEQEITIDLALPVED